MSVSRYGNFMLGRKLFATDFLNIKSPSSGAVAAPDGTNLNYTDVEGIYNIQTAFQYPNPVITYNLGFTPALLTVSGENAAYQQQTIDISTYAGATVQAVFHYIMTTTSFTGDIQLDLINLDGNSYSFENTNESFEANIAAGVNSQTTYNTVSWQALPVNTAVNGQWSAFTGNTGSNGTGNLGAFDGTWFVYTETSGANAGYPSAAPDEIHFWLRSPQVILGPTPTFTFYEGREGVSIGQLDVHLDVLA